MNFIAMTFEHYALCTLYIYGIQCADCIKIIDCLSGLH